MGQSMFQWFPGLDNADLSMQEVLDSFPGNEQADIHILVRLFENPDSPIAFKGAINLERHDCVHVILGRGIYPQDEAFVIGFTMGTSKDIPEWEVWLFERIAQYIYPNQYKFTPEELRIFELGLAYGKACKTRCIYDFPFEEHLNETVGSLREKLGINVKELMDIYQAECAIRPDTKVSKRLKEHCEQLQQDV